MISFHSIYPLLILAATINHNLNHCLPVICHQSLPLILMKTHVEVGSRMLASLGSNQSVWTWIRQTKQAIDAFADWGRFQLQKIFHEVWGCMSLHYQTAYIFCLIDTQNETVEGLIPSIKLDQGALHTNIHDHAHTDYKLQSQRLIA